jgi:hypothetical protein
MTSKTVEERMEPVEAQGQAVARQMVQIANLLENALPIQPSPTPILTTTDTRHTRLERSSQTRTSHPVHPLLSRSQQLPQRESRIVPILPLPASPPAYHRLHTSLTLILRSQ